MVGTVRRTVYGNICIFIAGECRVELTARRDGGGSDGQFGE